MRTRLRHAAVATTVTLGLLLAGCSGSAAPEEGATTASSTEGEAPTTESTPTPAPTPEAPPVLTTLDPAAVLPASAFGGDASTPVDATEAIDLWALPPSCQAGAPTSATAAYAVGYGDGEYESSVGVQQLAVFADADAATAEAQRVRDAATACAGPDPESGSIYIVEDAAVGAQGMGAAVDYYGSSATGSVDEAMGYFVVMTRRGNAVTFVGYVGGESNLADSRADALAAGQAAWELLCVYDSAGC